MKIILNNLFMLFVTSATLLLSYNFYILLYYIPHYHLSWFSSIILQLQYLNKCFLLVCWGLFIIYHIKSDTKDSNGGYND